MKLTIIEGTREEIESFLALSSVPKPTLTKGQIAYRKRKARKADRISAH